MNFTSYFYVHADTFDGMFGAFENFWVAQFFFLGHPRGMATVQSSVKIVLIRPNPNFTWVYFFVFFQQERSELLSKLVRILVFILFFSIFETLLVHALPRSQEFGNFSALKSELIATFFNFSGWITKLRFLSTSIFFDSRQRLVNLFSCLIGKVAHISLCIFKLLSDNCFCKSKFC